jgi:membrane fusion protein (multidrug efflux system)
VITVEPQKTALTAELPGRTSAYLIAEVRPQVGGIIQKRLFTEGTDVKEGDILYQIEPVVFEAAYAKAKADRIKAEARIVALKYKHERYKTLIKSNAVSQQDYDNAESDYRSAEADVQAAKAAEDAARINLGYTKVTAPISGRIGKSNVTVGALVTANHPTPLATVQQIDPIYVDVTQSSADYLHLKRRADQGVVKRSGNGAKAKIFFEDGTLYPLEGRMQFRDLTVDQSTGAMILRVLVPNPDKALLPGMYVRAELEEGVMEKAILAPHQAVTRGMRGEPSALVVNSAGMVEPRALTVDGSIDSNWIVRDGLNAGDKLIMEGFQKIRPGMPVRAAPFSAEKKAPPAAAQTAAGEAAPPKTNQTAPNTGKAPADAPKTAGAGKISDERRETR